MSKPGKIGVILYILLIVLISFSPPGDCYDLTGSFGGAIGINVNGEASITLIIPSEARPYPIHVYYEFSAEPPPGAVAYVYGQMNFACPRFTVSVNGSQIHNDSITTTQDNYYYGTKTGTFFIPAGTTANFTAYSGFSSFYGYVGFQYVVSYRFTYVIDNQPPTVNITNPINADVRGNVNITVDATDNYQVARVEFYIDGNKQLTDTSAPYSYNWDTNAYDNGTHNITVIAYDASGNSRSTGKTVTIDNELPVINITGPVNNCVKGTVNISIDATDNIGIGSADFYINNIKQTTVTGPPYSYAWNTASYTNEIHTITVTVYDKAGNFQSVTKNLTVDNELPTVSITSPADTGVSGNTTVTAAAGDNHQLAQVEFYIDNVKKSTLTNAPYSYAWDTRTYSNGSHIITVKVYDLAGNSQSADKTVTITNPDTTPPVVTITSPLNGATVSGQVNVNVNATDTQSNIVKVEFYIDGILKSTATIAPYSYSFPATGSKHTIKAIAYDGAGITGEDTIDINVQTHIDINNVNLLPTLN